MTEYIDRTKLEPHQIYNEDEWVEVVYMDDIREMPIIEAEPIKHGRWVRDAENFGKYYCSECGFSYIPIDVPKHNFCPTCGARMDEE